MTESRSTSANGRETFRDVATPGTPAWQRQLRDRYADIPAPDVDLSLKTSRVRPIGRRMAENIILRYEWLGTMASSSHHYGIFFGNYCAGATCVAVGSGTAGSNVAAFFGLEPRQMAILARGACVHWAPNGANSRLVSWTAKLVARDSAAKLMIAYADTDAGEIGTIYQACGWTYIGQSASVHQYVAPNGRIYDRRILHARGTARGVSGRQYAAYLIAHGWRRQDSNPKHRYVTILDRSDAALVDRIGAMALPYPKRSQCSGTVGVQPNGGDSFRPDRS